MVCNDSKKKMKNKNSNSNRWDEAIEDAKDTISKCERKIATMKTAIAIFKQSKEEGAVFPASQSTAQSEVQQHSVPEFARFRHIRPGFPERKNFHP